MASPSEGATLIKCSTRTYFSLSPSHLDTRSEDEMEKNVELLASVATALARYDFPVPGGPKSKIPLHGVLFPRGKRLHGCNVSSKHKEVQISTGDLRHE